MKTILRSQDLTCPSCVTKIEKALSALEGVAEAKVHFNTGRIEVVHEADQVTSQDLADSVRKVGYESQVSPY